MEAAEEELKLKQLSEKRLPHQLKCIQTHREGIPKANFHRMRTQIALGRKLPAPHPNSGGGKKKRQNNTILGNKGRVSKICPQLSSWWKLQNSNLKTQRFYQKCPLKSFSLENPMQIHLFMWLKCLAHCNVVHSHSMRLQLCLRCLPSQDLTPLSFPAFVFLAQNSLEATATGWRRWWSLMLTDPLKSCFIAGASRVSGNGTVESSPSRCASVISCSDVPRVVQRVGNGLYCGLNSSSRSRFFFVCFL